MPYDATYETATTTLWSPAPLRPAEGVLEPTEGLSLGVGALALGALAGASAFFGMGRVEPVIPLTASFAGYAYALYLAGMSMRDVIIGREQRAIALFGIHLAALIAWPLLLVYGSAMPWLGLLGLPTAFATLVLFLMLAHAPARAASRSSAHVFLVATIAVYHGLWAVMTVNT